MTCRRLCRACAKLWTRASPRQNTSSNTLMAAATMMVVPVVLLFFFTQRYFIQGVTLTGIKG